MNIQDSTILVTGGSSGIGKAIAGLLVENGAKVAITGRDKSKLDRVAEEFECVAISEDVSSEEGVKRTYGEFFSKFDHLDCLINNAGIGVFSPLVELSADEMRRVWETNVLGAMLMAQQAARHFITRGKGGNIVNIASTAAVKGYAGGTAYSGSKFALRAMTQTWQEELRKHNVRVIGINPSYVATAFNQSDRVERDEESNKLTSKEISHAILSTLQMDDRGFIPELTVFATNPY